MDPKMTHDDRILAIFTAVIIVSVIALATCSFTSMAGAKELPEIVSIDDLAEHDGRRVAVEGWIRSEEYFRGRRGSDNLKHRFGEGEHEIFIYTVFPTYLLNKKAMVIGVYRKEGKFAGQLVENYIYAEWVIREGE